MAIKAPRKKSDFVPAPEGVYVAVCCDVTEPTLVPHSFKPGEQQETITIHWLLDELNPKTGRPFEVQQRFNLSMFAGRDGDGRGNVSNLYKLVKSWLNTTMTQDEADDFDLESLLGQSCQLQVEHNIKDNGDVYANVGGIFSLKAGMQALKVPGDYIRRKDRVRT